VNRTLKIKVCGMKDPGNLEALCELSPDYVGYIFYDGSPRFVGKHPDPALFKIPGDRTLRVGVFVNESLAEVRRIAVAGMVDMVQLHGNESLEYCRDIAAEGIPVIRSARPSSSGHGVMMDYRDLIDCFLFDTPDPSHGGTGRKFDWSLLRKYDGPLPFLLSGGIGPGDAPLVADLDNKYIRGVDVNSQFEKSPGIKDMGLLREFFSEIRNTAS
jgi:phosphoribosylanthranilate isomerase